MSDPVFRIGQMTDDALRSQVGRMAEKIQTGLVTAANMPGLYLRVGRRSHSWQGRYYLDGREKRLRLGYWPLMSVEKAIDAHTANRERVQQGIAPITPRQAPYGHSLGDLVDEWQANNGTATARHRANIVRRTFQPLLGHDARFISRDHIKPIANLIRQEKGPTLRNALDNLSAVFNYGKQVELVDHNPTAGIKRPARSLDPNWFTLVDLFTLFRAFDQLAEWEQRFLLFLVLTGCRSGETMAANVGHFDPSADMVTLPPPLTKNGAGLMIPLPPFTLKVVTDAVGDRTDGNAPLFASRTGGRIDQHQKRGLITFCNANRATPLHRGTSPGWARIHAFRKSMVTEGCALGLPRDVLDRMLNHVAISTTSQVLAAYSLSERLEERVAAANAWASVIECIYKHAVEKTLPMPRRPELKNIVNQLYWKGKT
ncbi:tyrosine-type recombinase/integrase [Ruegeria lacuscaerulensis]|uniref:tyrosine-type recombinase/integrase n=1 Tax=Ruegeria lacuscaerulensis TaxID=55218 RepID=UPI00147E43F6|nr:integrase family protein [Ruegeria lacuscaerulensis]